LFIHSKYQGETFGEEKLYLIFESKVDQILQIKFNFGAKDIKIIDHKMNVEDKWRL